MCIRSELRHDVQCALVCFERATHQEHQWEEIHGVVEGSELASNLESCVTWNDCSHALEGTSFEREKEFAVRGCAFCENSEGRIVDASIFNHSLSLNDRLYN